MGTVTVQIEGAGDGGPAGCAGAGVGLECLDGSGRWHDRFSQTGGWSRPALAKRGGGRCKGLSTQPGAPVR